MRKLLLTSSGISEEKVQSTFFNLVGKKAEDILVCFIPTAADPESDKIFDHLNEKKLLI